MRVHTERKYPGVPRPSAASSEASAPLNSANPPVTARKMMTIRSPDHPARRSSQRSITRKPGRRRVDRSHIGRGEMKWCWREASPGAHPPPACTESRHFVPRPAEPAQTRTSPRHLGAKRNLFATRRRERLQKVTIRHKCVLTLHERLVHHDLAVSHHDKASA